MTLRLTKGHGTGNDFLILADPDGETDPSPELVAALCARGSGFGADGLLRVVPSAAVAEFADQAQAAPWAMDYRNADGSVAEMCGNGVRVFVAFLLREGWAAPGRLAVASRAGVRQVVTRDSGSYRVEMGPVRLDRAPGVTVGGRPATFVDVGNPHLVVAVDDLSDPQATGAQGAALNRPLLDPPDACPGGVNVEYVQISGASALRMRVHERGVGETRSCGTGAVAAAAAAAAWTGSAGEDVATGSWQVDVPGGRLGVDLLPGASYLTGPAVLLGDIEVSDAWLAEQLPAAHRSPVAG